MCLNLEPFMQRCLEIAFFGRKRVGNGALVGAVLVRGERIIAEGIHWGFGEAHAERQLLENFDQEIQREDILFVNLEPCCHYGKTPPCTTVILERGIKHVVYGLLDPDPRVSGRGMALLMEQGVHVTGPIARATGEWLNRGFFHVRTRGRPWITLKTAKTRQGQTAHPDRTPLKITSPEQDCWSHTYLRDQLDAILVGVQTIQSDNPKLNTRLVQKKEIDLQRALFEKMNGKSKKFEQIQPFRIVLDPHFRIPRQANVLTDENRERTILIVDQETFEKKASDIRLVQDSGVRIFPVPTKEGFFDLQALSQVLITPVDRYNGLTSVLVEGGSRTSNCFREAGYVDEEVVLVGPSEH